MLIRCSSLTVRRNTDIMADISVQGWIAEGCPTIIERGKNKILLFDIVENTNHVGGIDNDEFRTNSAWFHCSFEINIEDTSKASLIPVGYTLDKVHSNGWAWVKKEGTAYEHLTNLDTFLNVEQVADYIKEGKSVYVSGQEYLLTGIDGKLLRMIDVTEISLQPRWMREKPKILKVPYNCGLYITKTYPSNDEKKA